MTVDFVSVGIRLADALAAFREAVLAADSDAETRAAEAVAAVVGNELAHAHRLGLNRLTGIRGHFAADQYRPSGGGFAAQACEERVFG